MTETKTRSTLNRREMAGLTMAAAALAASPALAAQPHMEKALNQCQRALAQLRAATPNKGGHRATAIKHLKYVIDEIKRGIEHAD